MRDVFFETVLKPKDLKCLIEGLEKNKGIIGVVVGVCESTRVM